MTADLFAIIGVGIALAGLILYLARGMNEMRRDIGALRESMARLEGLFEGFAGRKSDKPE